jgi:hypothetical protein
MCYDKIRRDNAIRNVTALILFLALASIIGYKTIFVPITFDENRSSLFYPSFSAWQIMMYPDCLPNNHILNTLSIKLSESLFGTNTLSIRLPNFIMFVFFFWVMYSLAVRYFRDSYFLFCIPMVVMFCNASLLDFFGLGRGYGMSNAFMAGSIYFLFLYLDTKRMLWWFLTIVMSILASYSNFTLLIYWVVVQIILSLILLSEYIKGEKALGKTVYTFFSMGLIAAIYMALCYVPIYKMKSNNQFNYWENKGFYTDTILNQIICFRYNVGGMDDVTFRLGLAVLALLIIIGLYVFWKIYKKGGAALNDKLVVFYLILMLFALVNIGQAHFLGTAYLVSRTGLCYYVLFVFVIIFFVRDICLAYPVTRSGLTLSLVAFSCIHCIHTINLSVVREWWFDANTYQVADYLKSYLIAHPEKENIELNTSWLLNPSFEFYTKTGKYPWLKLSDFHPQIDTMSQTLFYYAVSEDIPFLKGYIPVLKFDYGSRVLLIKNEPSGN